MPDLGLSCLGEIEGYDLDLSYLSENYVDLDLLR